MSGNLFLYLAGVNSGVMLMNLTRLRKSNWQSAILEYYKIYKMYIVFGDQDLINIYFHFHSGNTNEHYLELEQFYH